MAITVTKQLGWDSAHRVLRHESKCKTLHGHRYLAEITCTAPELDSVGRVIDFGVIKEKVGKWIDDHLDHTTIVNVEDTHLREFCQHMVHDFANRPAYILQGEPTAENIAKEIMRMSEHLLDGTGVTVSEVVVWETPTSKATVTR